MDDEIEAQEIMGIVEKVIVNRTPGKFKLLVEDEEGQKPTPYLCTCPFFLPVREGDVVFGMIDPNTYTFVSPPFVKISVSENNVIHFMASLYIKGVYPDKWKEIYRKIWEKYQNKNKIVQMIDLWAFNYTKTKDLEQIPSNIYVMLNETQWGTLLSRWYSSWSMRSLYLMGLSKKEINACKIPPNLIYERCMKNPFALAPVPMEKCETIFSKLDRTPTDEQRTCGIILRHLFKHTVNGTDCFLKYEGFVKQYPMIPNLRELLENEYDVAFDPDGDESQIRRVYYKPVLETEKIVAEFLAELMDRPPPFPINPVYKIKTLSSEQKEAIHMALNNNISIITGGPGRGKSLICSEIINNLVMNHVDYALTSFTGKAVARLKQLNKVETAATMNQFMANLRTSKFDVVILDEASMVTTDLIHQFIEVFHRNPFRIVCIGDDNQLPPLSWGYFFKSLLMITQIPRVKLMKNHRIVLEGKEKINEHGIHINCQMILEAPPCEFIPSDTFTLVEGDMDTVLEITQQFIDSGYKQEEVECLCPYNADVKLLNPKLSELFHPDTIRVSEQVSDVEWCVGDLAMMIENCYNINVMNGEIGTVQQIDETMIYVKFDQQTHPFKLVKGIQFDEGENFEESETNEENLTVRCLQQAYCLTAHKSQGSEWNLVIVYISHLPAKVTRNPFIAKELIYTMISRPKMSCYLVYPQGKLESLQKFAGISSKNSRNDWLHHRVQDYLKITEVEEEVEDEE